MIDPTGSPSGPVASARASALPRISTHLGRHGGSTSSTTKATFGLRCALRNFRVRAKSPPKLASRVRLLQAGDTSKNDPNDALSVAVAALRSRTCRQVAAEDHPAVLKVWSKRHRDLARLRNQAACRCTPVLCDLVPGGHPGDLRSSGRQGPGAGLAIRSC